MRRLICALLGHRWGAWVRVLETMTIVSECSRCPEVRTTRYEPLIPDAVLEEFVAQLVRPNPYRAFRRSIARGPKSPR